MDLEAGRLRGGQKISRHHLRAGRRAVRSAQAKISWPGGKTERAPSNCCPAKPTSARPATKCGWKNPAGNRAWRLVGTVAEGTLCHKPCTVSGGGKSEISKPITDAILTGPVFVADFKKDFDQRRRIDRARLQRTVSKTRRKRTRTRARFSAPERSLGSVIKLLTPDEQRLHARIQRLARKHSAIHQGTGLRGEAFLQAGVGRELARAFQRGHHQRHAGQRIEMRQPQARHHASARRASTPTVRGARSACARIFIRR